MKIIKEGTLPDEDILRKHYQCQRCLCIFQLDTDDLIAKPAVNMHTSDPYRYQTCPTCEHEVAIYDRNTWVTPMMQPKYTPPKFRVENPGMSLSRAMYEDNNRVNPVSTSPSGHWED